MADQLDRAWELSEMHLKHILLNRPQMHGESSTYCLECAEPIPELRQKAISGCQLCKECAEEKERK